MNIFDASIFDIALFIIKVICAFGIVVSIPAITIFILKFIKSICLIPFKELEKMREKKGSELGFFDYLQFALVSIWIVSIAIVLIKEIIPEWIDFLIKQDIEEIQNGNRSPYQIDDPDE